MLSKPHTLHRYGRIAKARPRWLQALGTEGPPASIAMDGDHDRADIFKHDSWAATALYQSPAGTRWVVKFHRQSPVGGLPMAWFGRLVARHERDLLQRLRDIKAFPHRRGGHRHGRPLSNAVAVRTLPGIRWVAERVADEFFPP